MLSQEKSLQEFRRLGWKISGTLDNALELYKAPSDSRLRAKIRVIKEEGITYRAIGIVYLEEDRQILIDGCRISGPIAKTFRDLERRIVGKFEPYFSGRTDDEHTKEIYNRYKK